MLEAPSLVTLAEREIRRLILAGDLRPGERLFEVRLSERLGISRPPLREALRALATRGILQQSPRHGYRVVELTERDVAEIYSLRSALERFAVEQAVPSLRDEDLWKFEEIMTAMWQAARDNDDVAVVAANREFHVALVGLGGHGRLTAAYETVMDQMQLCMSRNLRNEARSAGNLLAGCRRHERLLDAIRTRDMDHIRAELARHGELSYLTGG